MPEVRIENSFELLTQDEWDEYLSTSLFDSMRLDPTGFNVTGDVLHDLSYPRLFELIEEHNNKVGSLVITYALCRHYFDRGIPDEPWFASPGSNGESIQYMPLFKEEHWMRRYWFNYFSDTFYLKIFSVWDSVIDIINDFYDLDYPSDLRLRSAVLKWLKRNQPSIHTVFDAMLSDDRYSDAQKYRTLAAHGTSPSSVTNTVSRQKNVMTEVPITDENGMMVMKPIKAALVVSVSAGEYTNVEKIVGNMQDYTTYSGQKMQEIMNLMRT